MFRVLVTSYNAQKYLPKCLTSLKEQTYQNWVCYVTDDMSTDNSREYVKQLAIRDSRIKLIENTRKLYQPGNYHQVLQQEHIQPEDVAVALDGDDYLYHKEVLAELAQQYEDPNLWMTWGRQIEMDGPSIKRVWPMIDSTADIDDVRSNKFLVDHLQTWRVFLFRAIREQDLKAPNGNFWEVAGDKAFLYPMVEMAGKERVAPQLRVSYVYNSGNPLCDWRTNPGKGLEYSRLISRMPRYPKYEVMISQGLDKPLPPPEPRRRAIVSIPSMGISEPVKSWDPVGKAMKAESGGVSSGDVLEALLKDASTIHVIGSPEVALRASTVLWDAEKEEMILGEEDNLGTTISTNYGEELNPKSTDKFLKGLTSITEATLILGWKSFKSVGGLKVKNPRSPSYLKEKLTMMGFYFDNDTTVKLNTPDLFVFRRR
jgi:hypothetical protein